MSTKKKSNTILDKLDQSLRKEFERVCEENKDLRMQVQSFNDSRACKTPDDRATAMTINKMPAGEGRRDIKRPRHDLIPIEFLDELASIFEEGLLKYGDSWKRGGSDFLLDCLNHASNHLHLYMNGDRKENHLAKTAWNTLAVAFFKNR